MWLPPEGGSHGLGDLGYFAVILAVASVSVAAADIAPKYDTNRFVSGAS
jgi:hypothetical protein